MKRRKSRQTGSDPTSFGNLARILGILNDAQLSAALNWQDRHPSAMLGEGLVERGVLTEDQVAYVLRKQESLRANEPPTRNDVKRYLDFAVRQLNQSPKLEQLRDTAMKKTHE